MGVFGGEGNARSDPKRWRPMRSKKNVYWSMRYLFGARESLVAAAAVVGHGGLLDFPSSRMLFELRKYVRCAKQVKQHANIFGARLGK